MPVVKKLIWSVFSMAVTACAFQAQPTKTIYQISSEAIQRKDFYYAARTIVAPLAKPDPEKYNEVISKLKENKDDFYVQLKRNASSQYSDYEILNLSEFIEKPLVREILGEERQKEIREVMSKTAINDFKSRPEVYYDKDLSSLKPYFESFDTDSIFKENLLKPADDSSAQKIILTVLPLASEDVRKKQESPLLLKKYPKKFYENKYLNSIYPDFSKRAVSLYSKKITLTSTPEDPLLLDDILELFKAKNDWLEISTNGDGRSGHSVDFKKLRLEEKPNKVKRYTVTVNDIDVDFAPRALYLPNRASVLYDVEAEYAEIEYAFDLTLNFNGKKLESKLVRGRASKDRVACGNFRFVNVFGGGGSFPVLPNDEAKQTCTRQDQNPNTYLRNSLHQELGNGLNMLLSTLDGKSK